MSLCDPYKKPQPAAKGSNCERCAGSLKMREMDGFQRARPAHGGTWMASEEDAVAVAAGAGARGQLELE
ncbi:hypothetical protein O9K51_00408 [Purpureocillium lavendulum]|uniref:Uncharacterized protein n=1 Tax=Purpureocillium lavendulum TaxID=1247861 RepID=A0AB34G1Z1_9HYPO|nr:hypothetical protein O9K51_00408 [Purpureocillium lavendulum]